MLGEITVNYSILCSIEWNIFIVSHYFCIVFQWACSRGLWYCLFWMNEWMNACLIKTRFFHSCLTFSQALAMGVHLWCLEMLSRKLTFFINTVQLYKPLFMFHLCCKETSRLCRSLGRKWHVVSGRIETSNDRELHVMCCSGWVFLKRDIHWWFGSQEFLPLGQTLHPSCMWWHFADL